MKSWPVQDAKARFSELLETCLREGPQLVTRRGEKAAVLVPVTYWQQLVQCGSTCGMVTTSGQFLVTGHKWIYSNPLDGAHGHSYAGQSDISTLTPLLSGYIPYS